MRSLPVITEPFLRSTVVLDLPGLGLVMIMRMVICTHIHVNDDGQEARKMVKVQYLHREIVNVALGEVFAQNVKTACWHETIDNSGAMLQTKDRGKQFGNIIRSKL